MKVFHVDANYIKHL